MKHPGIAFIGGGNMARSLIGGLIANGYDPAGIIVSDPDAQQRAGLAADFGIDARPENVDAVRAADIVLLAVKPQLMERVAAGIRSTLGQRGRLVISIAAGIRTGALELWLGPSATVVRAMPNTPALVRSAVTVLYANARVTMAQRNTAESILRAVGSTLWIDDEALMDAVTALSGSGPAYFFLVMEAMEAAGCRLGLPADTARRLTVETALGAARMALESGTASAALRAQVTSPGGTTERAIAVLQDGRLPDLFEKALAAARERSTELSKTFGGEHG